MRNPTKVNNSTLDSLIRTNPFKDARGKIVVFQFPNRLLLAAIVSRFFQLIFTDTVVGIFAKALFIVFVVLWSYQEFSQGDSLFRKVLGLIFLLLSILNIYRLLS